ncbi:COG1361 S-layer family protein [Haloarcula nitratireducens]|uniref:FxLYD domain-containing protein n=1 Tax=Haloarcula nitratireducens TaxID=2487749 RepID=A0AAW4P8N4_9EURY|nr:NEW3 domain-containing protein [Halomicroarcula nitratireducens]MBX0294287.1 FxLYD domain-containing protein [Halomicroarcula nitratireducens]
MNRALVVVVVLVATAPIATVTGGSLAATTDMGAADGGMDGGTDDGTDGGSGDEETTQSDSSGTGGVRLVDVDEDLRINETGTVSIKLENEDLGDLSDATVVLRSANPEIRVGSGLNGSRFVGDWEEGERKRVKFAVTPTADASRQRYPLTVVVRYPDSEGDTVQSAPLSFGVKPEREQGFHVDDVDGSLRAGDDGEIDVTVENDGPRDVERTVLVVRETADGVAPLKSEVALGEFEKDDSRTVTLPFRVDRTAKPTTRQFEFALRYTTKDGERRASGPLFGDVKIREREDVIDVADVDSDAQVGARGTVTVTLENEGDEDLTDARVTFSSLDAGFRFGDARNTTRFAGEWEAGEERTFDLPTRFSNDSATDEYPVSVTTRYTDEDGDDQVADDVQFGVEPDDEQSFDLEDVSGDLRVGDDGTIEGTVTNDGPRDVTDAVLVYRSDIEGVTPRQREVPLRDLDEDEEVDFELPLRVDDTVEPTDRQFEFAVRYTNDEGERRTSDPLFATVRIREEVDVIEVVEVDSASQVGDRGTASVTLVNDGEEELRDARVTFSSLDRSLRFGNASNTSRFVARWDPGEERTFDLATRLPAEAATGEYPVSVRTRYTDEDGDEQVADDVQFGVTPDAEQGFDVDDPEGQLRVGRDGTISGVVENEGPQDAESAVLRVIPPGDDFAALESEYVLGNFDSGENATFEFPIRVRDGARPGRKQFEFVVEYRNDEGDVLESQRLAARYRVAGAADQFRVTNAESDVQVGEDGTVALTLRYTGEEELTDAVVQLQSVSGDLTVGAGGGVNGSRAVGQWDPGERRTVRFQVAAPNDTAPQDYPFDVRVTYEDEDGDRQRSEAISLAIRPAPEQSFSVSGVSGALEVGAESDLTGRVVNDGPRDVENVVVEIRSTTESLAPRETEYAVGNLSEGEFSRFRLPVVVPEDAAAIPKQAQFVVRYTTADGDRRATDPLSSTLSVAGETDTVRVVDLNESVRAGEDGNVTVTLENAGEEAIRQVRVSLRSQSGELQVQDSANASRFVDELAPDERRTVSYQVTAPEDGGGQRYPLRLRATYEDETGDSQPAESTLLGVTAAPEQSFAVGNVSGTLRVGSEGTLLATVTNRGPTTVTDAVVRLSAGSENVVIRENESPVGRLAPEEAATVSFPVEVLDETEPGDRRVSFVVEYRNRDRENRESDSLPGVVGVADRRPVFGVTTGNAAIEAGDTELITLNVTNNADVPVANVDARVFVDDPLSTDDEQAFVDRLEPNETVRLTFAISATESATLKDYPLLVDFQYDEPDEETKLSDTYRVAVGIVEPVDDGIPWLLLLAVLLVLLAVAAVLYRRRRSADENGREGGTGTDDDPETAGG